MMSNDDSELFRSAVKGARPLVHEQRSTDHLDTIKNPALSLSKRERLTHRHPTLAEPTEQKRFQLTEGSTPFTSDRDWIPLVEPESTLFYQRSGLPIKRIRDLKAGRIPIEAHLDLHGRTLVQASNDLYHFLEEAKQLGKRCVRIVHGKGRVVTNQSPILKSAIKHWLEHYSDTLAFSSAQPNHGGRGAIYLLLKAHRTRK